jgi:hypothetical protein
MPQLLSALKNAEGAPGSLFVPGSWVFLLRNFRPSTLNIQLLAIIFEPLEGGPGTASIFCLSAGAEFRDPETETGNSKIHT